jgi:hypothetical protein
VTLTNWWSRAPGILDRYGEASFSCASIADRPNAKWFRFALGWLCLVSDDAPLTERFLQIYPEGAELGPAPVNVLRVCCRVSIIDDPPLALIQIDDPEPLDGFAFSRTLFPDRSYIEGPAAPGGWRTMASEQTPDSPFVALCGNSALVDREQVWQPFIANYIVSRVLRLQRQLLFFHAGSIGIDGHGLMVTGPKNSGKTTTSMTLAARGHSFLGDEMAAVHKQTGEMFPFRRAASIRVGPRGNRVAVQLSQRNYATERFPDGGERVLANIGELFPEATASPATLTSVFFLRRFATRPKAELFAFGVEHFHMLSPLACSMWGAPAVVRMMDLAKLVGRAKCYFLDPGEPDDTADLIERIVRGGVE